MDFIARSMFMGLNSIKNIFFTLGIAISSVAYPINTYAAKQYRCQGKVQYRPCEQALITHSGIYSSPYRALQDSAARNARAQIKRQSNNTMGELYAEVIRSNFKKLPRAEGQWRGIIRGNGTIHLTLQILRNGIPESTRYMGNITLLNSETSFNFVSTSPPGKDWTWQILALAKQG